jgi:hypothetical protein
MWFARRNVGVGVLLLAAGLLPAAAQGVVIRSDASDQQYVALGAEYPSVGCFDGTTSSSSFLASGTLIAPSWVLTAAHVVDHAQSLEFTVGGVTYTADRSIANPNWTGNLWSGYDIGLVHLSAPVTNVTPAAIYTGQGELNQTVTTVGYGKTGTGTTGAVLLDGQKRGGQNIVDRIVNDRLLVSDFDDPASSVGMLGNARTLALEGLIAPGDSGGGEFMQVGDASYVVGVNSFVGSATGVPNSGYGDLEGQTRVAAFADWIEGVIDGGPSPVPTFTESAAQPIAPPADFQPEVVPEPGTLGLLMAALACMALCLGRRVPIL